MQNGQYRRIEFHAASKHTGASMIYSKNDRTGAVSKPNGDKDKPRVNSKDGLFPADIVAQHAKWQRVAPVGPGIFNHGNTCFLNAALQCLIHTPALAQLLVNEQHAIDDLLRSASNQRFSVLIMLKNIITNAWQGQGQKGGGGAQKKVISAHGLVQNLRCVGKHFRPGR